MVEEARISSVLPAKTRCRSGYYGSVVFKATGSASKLNIVLNMMTEPEKAAMMMLMETKEANSLSRLLTEELELDKPNTGMLVKLGVNKAVNCPQNDKESEVPSK